MFDGRFRHVPALVWLPRRVARLPRGVALVMGLVLVASLLAVPLLIPGLLDGPDAARSVAVGRLKAKPPKGSQTDGSGVTSPGKESLPAGGSADVAVSGRTARVGGLPVTVSAVGAGAPKTVHVQVAEQAVAAAAGVAGTIVALSRVGPVADSPSWRGVSCAVGAGSRRVKRSNFAIFRCCHGGVARSRVGPPIGHDGLQA